MNIARLFAPTIRAASSVDVIGYRVSRSFSTRKALLSTLPVSKNNIRSLSMSSTTVRRNKGGKEKKAPAIPRPSSRYVKSFSQKPIQISVFPPFLAHHHRIEPTTHVIWGELHILPYAVIETRLIELLSRNFRKEHFGTR